MHLSICEQEWKEFLSSSKAAELAPVYQPGATLLSLFPAVFQAEPCGVHSRVAWAVQCPKGAQSWVCSGCPWCPRAVPADVSHPLCPPAVPGTQQGVCWPWHRGWLWALPRAWGTQQCLLWLHTCPGHSSGHLMCMSTQISTVSMHSTPLLSVGPGNS